MTILRHDYMYGRDESEVTATFYYDGTVGDTDLVLVQSVLSEVYRRYRSNRDSIDANLEVLVRWVVEPPKPPPLRELVAKAWCADYYGEDSGSAKNPAPEQAAAADAVLAVVADWLAAQPVHDGTAAGLWALEPRLAQRDHDVHLLRGEAS